jgi:hypothetical protein
LRRRVRDRSRLSGILPRYGGGVDPDHGDKKNRRRTERKEFRDLVRSDGAAPLKMHALVHGQNFANSKQAQTL